jgi:hypothetical protein
MVAAHTCGSHSLAVDMILSVQRYPVHGAQRFIFIAGLIPVFQSYVPFAFEFLGLHIRVPFIQLLCPLYIFPHSAN